MSILLTLCLCIMQAQAQIITSIAGSGSTIPYTGSYTGDGGPATNATLNEPFGITMDAAGNLFFADVYNSVIRKINTSGIISTIAGGGVSYPGSGGPATAAALVYPTYLAFDNSGNLYFSDNDSRVKEIALGGASSIDGSCIISVYAGNGAAGYSGDTGPATAAELDNPSGIVFDVSNNLYIGDDYNSNFRMVDATTGKITTVAGSSMGFGGDGGPASTAKFWGISGICLDPSGDLILADFDNNRVRKILVNSLTGLIDGSCTVSTIAGGGVGGDGGPATAASLWGPSDVHYDPSGNLLISEYADPSPKLGNDDIRIVNGSGVINTITGNGTYGFSGDGYYAYLAQVDFPSGITTDPIGNIYFSDTYNDRIRKIGVIPTPAFVAGGSCTVSSVCENGSPVDVTSCLAITDGILGNLETWSVPTGSGPSNGTLIGFPFATTYTGGTLTPSGLTYTPTSGFYGTDVFTVEITDMSVHAFIAVSVTVLQTDIAGTATVCPGLTTTLTDPTPGGTWTSDYPSIAIIGSSSGVVTGIIGGTTNITYTSPTGCTASITVTVNPAPAITGTIPVCVGLSTTLSDPTGGGIWTSDNTSVATIGSSSGIVTGISSGTSTISYQLPSTGCFVTIVMGVNPPPGTISGTMSVCTGGTTTLSDTPPGGLWANSNHAVATIGVTSGVVTGIAAGTTTITYGLGGCLSFTTLTVNASPSAITGGLAVCMGSTITLSDATSGGKWTSSNTSIANVGSSTGNVTGVTAGTVSISYTLSTGCYAVATVTVNPLPATISGALTVCVGLTTALSDATSGGTWSSSNTAIATIGSASGIATGVASGSATITYSLGTGCRRPVTLRVNSNPAAITGITSVCEGSTTTLSDATSGGTWSSDNTLVATVGSSSGIVTGVSAGAVTITYKLSTGCIAVITVNVNATPVAITGSSIVCAGYTTTLSDATSSGKWSSGSTAIATIGSGTGIVTGVSPGTATITYALGSCLATTVMTVISSPATITGTTSICQGATSTLSDATAGGTWSSSNTSIADIGSASGVVTGNTTGTATITYSIGGCFASTVVTIHTSPAAISGTLTFCVSFPASLSDATAGGVWSSDNTAIATVGSGSGLVTGVSSGTTIITYAIGSCIATVTVTVNPLPAIITGPSSVCVGSTISLTDATAGGSWSSSIPTNADVDPSTGVVTGYIGLSATTIYYTLPTGCYFGKGIIVNPLPAAITGSFEFCEGSTTTLADFTSGGTWSSDNSSVAIVGSTSGIVTGVSWGTADISYTLSTGCTISSMVTIDPLPAAITGNTNLCLATTSTLSDANTGGAWSSDNSAIATIDASTGDATGIGIGTTTITYTLPTGCLTTISVTVNPLPSAITGVTHVCTGVSIALSDATTGGTWSSTDASVVVGSSTGFVTGVSSGTAIITYTAPTGCTALTTLTIDLSPLPITGSSALCVGLTVTLSDATFGGTWSSSSTPVATIGSGSGVVSGLSAGTTLINYQTSNGCIASRVETVNPLPTTISGFKIACSGTTVALGDGISGGTWSTGGTSIATIGSSSGVVSGVSSGTTTVTYTLGTGCSTTTTVTVLESVEGCSPCSVFGSSTFDILGADGYITSSITGGGNYYIANDVTVTVNVTFTNAIILIAPGVTITVDPSHSMALDGCHLFSCNMWQGIFLDDNTSIPSSGRLSIYNNTLIEDANKAVYILHPEMPSAGFVFSSDGAIFNRNYVGVDIENCPTMLSSAPYSYPFQIRNTVFTSRDFKTPYGASYPYTWPPTVGAYGLKNAYSNPNIFEPPFSIDDPHVYSITPAPYSPIACKGGGYPSIGIQLGNVGACDPSTVFYGGSPAYPTKFSEIVIGDSTTVGGNPNRNLFDYLDYGIKAVNSNFTCVNDAFTHMQTYEDTKTLTWVGGDGIYANVTDHVSIHSRLRVFTPTGNTYQNLFYGFSNGVECHDYFELFGQNNYMINDSRTIGDDMLSVYGRYGYLVRTTMFDSMIMNSNTITNVDYGIALWENHDPMGPFGSLYALQGVLNANSNVIQAHPGGYPSITTQYVRQGIAIQNMAGMYTPAPINNVHADGNQIWDAYNGIYLNNLVTQVPTTSNNSIYVRPWVTGHIPPVQYGINHSHCSGSRVFNNFVTTSITGASNLSDSIKAIYSASTSLINMQCNTARHIGRGFEFFLQNPNTFWQNNSMDSNGKGMVLNAAVIDTQGAFLHPTGNQWSPTSGWWSTSTPQTYVFNGVASTINKMYVLNTLSGNPLEDMTNKPGKEYSVGSGRIQTTTYGSLPLYCPVDVTTGTTGGGTTTFEVMAQETVGYAYDIIPNNWMGQFKTWEALQIDTTLIDSSSVLLEFDTLASQSRYAFLTNIQSQLAQENFDSATTLLTSGRDTIADVDTDAATGVRLADNSSAITIVENYMSYYSLYIKYMDTTLSGTDSLSIMALAQLCPQRNGTVVYQARALYSFIYSDLSVFNDDSCITADTGYTAERHSNPHAHAPQGDTGIIQANAGQQYELFPNPSHGLINILQATVDEMPVNAEIWNAVGISVYKGKLLFNGSTEQIRLANVAPGLYLLKLTDSKGRRFIFKFVEE